MPSNNYAEFRDWSAFSYRMTEVDLSATDHGDGHWTVKGGKWIVHFWPFSKDRTIWVEGTDYKKKRGNVDSVIRVAKGYLVIPPNLLKSQKRLKPQKQNKQEQQVICPACGSPMLLRYSPKFGRKFYGCSKFPNCKEAHGAHPDGKPMGIPATAETKKARMRAHAAFDQLWINHPEKRTCARGAAYKALSCLMGITQEQCHFGSFSKEQCEQAIAICHDAVTFNKMMQEVMLKKIPES